MQILFLDDDDLRHRLFRRSLVGSPHAITPVKNAKEAIQALQTRRFDLVFLDHDLADQHYVTLQQASAGLWGASMGGEATGYEVARFIAEVLAADLRPRQLVVHSMNPEGSKRMVAALEGAGLEVHKITFGSKEFSRLLEQLRAKSI